MSQLSHLLDLELLLALRHIAACTGFGVLHLGCGSGICHLNVGHDGREVCGVLRGGIVVLSAELQGVVCCAIRLMFVSVGRTFWAR